MINSEHELKKTGKAVCGSEEVGVGKWFNTPMAAYPPGTIPHIATWVVFAHDCQQMTTSDGISSDPSDAGWTLPFSVIGSAVRVITPGGTYDSCYDTQSNCDEVDDRGEELTREPVKYCCEGVERPNRSHELKRLARKHRLEKLRPIWRRKGLIRIS